MTIKKEKAGIFTITSLLAIAVLAVTVFVYKEDLKKASNLNKELESYNTRLVIRGHELSDAKEKAEFALEKTNKKLAELEEKNEIEKAALEARRTRALSASREQEKEEVWIKDWIIDQVGTDMYVGDPGIEIVESKANDEFNSRSAPDRFYLPPSPSSSKLMILNDGKRPHSRIRAPNEIEVSRESDNSTIIINGLRH